MKKIKSFNGLKVLLALCIYSAHAHLMLRNFFSVSLFFMISGFLLYYTWNDRLKDYNFKMNIKWACRHVMKLYPLHICMFLASIIVRFDWVKSTPIKELLLKGFFNITLLQSFTESPYTFNYCSWYISTLSILYFIALPSIKFIKKNSKFTEMIITIILVFQYIVNYYFIKFDTLLSFIYSHPIYRFTDFILGMLAAEMYLKFIRTKEDGISINILNILQSIIVVLFTSMMIASFNFKETTNYFSMLFIFVLIILAFDKGWLADLLNSSRMQFLAKISFEFYMCHELILFVIESNMYNYLLINNEKLGLIIVWIIGLPISIICAKVLNSVITNKFTRW